MASLLGTNLINTLVGEEDESNVINAKAGDDTVVGGKLDDTLLGGAGNDTITAGQGNDLVWGGSGNDKILGGVGNDTIHGGLGNDLVSGGKGDDTLFGGKGNDTILGNSGNDIMAGGRGDDVLIGESGDDVMNGGSGNDVVKGGSGNDYILASSGNDVYSGGSGFDVLDYSQMKGNLDINLGKHTATVGSGHALNHDVVSGFELVIGTTGGNDHFVGDRNANTFVSGGGNDVFRGGLGADTFVGGAGADTMIITKKDIADGTSDRFVGFQAGVDKVDLSDFMKGKTSVDQEFRFLDVGNGDGGHATLVQAQVNHQWVNVINLIGVNPNDVGADHHHINAGDLGLLA